MMDDKCKREVAYEIAVRVGLLEKCPDHGNYIDPLNDGALEDAYKLANSLISSDDPLVAGFHGNRRKLTDILKNIRSSAGFSCSGCDARERD